MVYSGNYIDEHNCLILPIPKDNSKNFIVFSTVLLLSIIGTIKHEHQRRILLGTFILIDTLQGNELGNSAYGVAVNNLFIIAE